MRYLYTVLLVLSLATTAQARREPDAAAGPFDYYLLSLSIAPTFCSLSPQNQTKPDCEGLTQPAFEQTPLTLHGLWPNRARVSVNQQPHDCNGPPFAVSDTVQAQLRRYMPAGPGLERYEWRKHGTCSGLPADTYFASMGRLAQYANETIGAVMRDNNMLGHTLRIDDLLRGVGAKDPELAAALIVDCRTVRGGGDPLVQEIRVTLSKDFKPIPVGSVGMGHNSGCRGGAGLVPNVGG